jgi:hypothetical protein
MRIRKHERTLGDMISTAVFAGMGLWLGGEALLAAEAGLISKAVVIGICAGLSVLAALRHVIASIWLALFGDGR